MHILLDNGEWYLPKGKKYPGHLIHNREKEIIQLEIFGNEFIEGSTIESSIGHQQQYHPIILGYFSCNKTLYNCQFENCIEIGKDLFQITYRIEFVFTNVHFIEDSSIPVRAGTFIFPNLSCWYDGSLFLDKLKGKGGKYDRNGNHINESVLSEDDVKINDELTLHLWDEVNEFIEDMSISYKTEFQKFIRFQYSIEVPFKRLLNDAFTLLKFIQFCFGKPLNFKIVSAHVDPKYMSVENRQLQSNQTKYVLINVANYSLNYKTKIPSHGIGHRHMLLSRWNSTQFEMNQYIINWFKNETYSKVYEYYLESNNWLQGTDAKLSNVMVNNRFLNLIQALEDYFRINEDNYRANPKLIHDENYNLFKENKSAILELINVPSLKTWLNDTFKYTKFITLEQKLEIIINDLNPLLNKLFQKVSLNEFHNSAKKFRIDLSHGKNKEINLGNRFNEDYLIAHVILGTCILKTLEVNNIEDKISKYSKYSDAAYQVNLIQQQRIT